MYRGFKQVSQSCLFHHQITSLSYMYVTGMSNGVREGRHLQSNLRPILSSWSWFNTICTLCLQHLRSKSNRHHYFHGDLRPLSLSYLLLFSQTCIYLFVKQDLVIGLSALARGTIQDKLRWVFSLYDLDGDGLLSQDELFRIICAIYDLLGTESTNGEAAAMNHAEEIFTVCISLVVRLSLPLFGSISYHSFRFLFCTEIWYQQRWNNYNRAVSGFLFESELKIEVLRQFLINTDISCHYIFLFYRTTTLPGHLDTSIPSFE